MPRFFSTLHIAGLYEQPQNTEVAKNDWVRVRKFVGGTYPKAPPDLVEWTWQGEARRLAVAALGHAPYLVIDTEYVPETSQLLLLGLGGPETPVLQWWPHRESAEYSQTVRETMRHLVGSMPVVFQNAYADIPILEKALGLKYEDYHFIHDTMQLHACLWCELPHTLEFAESIYGEYEKFKHLPMTDPRYNAGDVLNTICFWEALLKEVERDPQSWWIYGNSMLPLIPIILEAQKLGIKVDRAQVEVIGAQYEANRLYAQRLAESYAGFPLNMGSPKQLKEFLSFDLKRKLKSTDEDVISTLRGAVLPFDANEEVTIALIKERIHQGAHPILEARVLYARSQQYLSHYIAPMLADPRGRVFPHFHPWAQNSGRWSTVNPPLGQQPLSLRAALIPDEGWCWLEFDFSAIELRIISVLSGDAMMLEAFEKEWDLHTVHLCDFFGFSPPKGWTKRDIQEDIEWRSLIGSDEYFNLIRTFAKTAVFRLCYGGLPESAPSIPGAKALGLTDAQLVSASKRWIAKHPAIKKFWRQIVQHSLRTRQLRTPLGRRWNFLSHDMQRIKRQMFDFPMQGTVADIKNLTLIRIKQALGERVRLFYEQHDSLKLGILISASLEEDKKTIIDIAEQLWVLNGREVRFPVEVHERG